MHAAIEFVLLLFRILGDIVIALVRSIIPTSRCDLSGEVVLITGGANGIGRQMAHKFASRGCTVVIWDIDEVGLDSVKRELHQKGHVTHCYKCDCSNREEIYRVAERVRREVDDVTILVNNAGTVSARKFFDLPDRHIEKVFNINALAHFWTCKAFLPAMMERNHGHVVTIASVAGKTGVGGLSEYCASKFAAVGFSESLRQEIRYAGKDGVHMTLVCPYHVGTDLFKGLQARFPAMLQTLDPEYVAEQVVTSVERKEWLVVLPRSFASLLTLSAILPYRSMDAIGDFLGAKHALDDYQGTGLKDE